MTERYKAEVRPELQTALTKNELERGYKRRVIIAPRDETKALADLAKRLGNEGPIPVSDRLKATMRPPRSFVETE
jgi:hypothetical protein